MVIEFNFENKKLKKFSGGNIIESGFSFLKKLEKPVLSIRKATKEEENLFNKNIKIGGERILSSETHGSGFVEVKNNI